jgi:hypothetical protein
MAVELWRLHKRPSSTAVCTIASTKVTTTLNVDLGGIALVSESFSTFQRARDRAENLRQEFIADGWSGIGPCADYRG